MDELMARRRRPIDRTTSPVRDASLVVIASEDQYAVKQYFQMFHSSRIQFVVLETQDGASSPKHLMTRLETYLKEFDIGPGDQFWLVLDRDHWCHANHIQNLSDALTSCRQKEISVAISDPCFELWLLLHFVDHPRKPGLTCKDLGALIKLDQGAYNKLKVYNLDIQIEDVRAAVDRAASRPVKSCEIPKQEYSTAVYLIVQSLLKRNMISIAE